MASVMVILGEKHTQKITKYKDGSLFCILRSYHFCGISMKIKIIIITIIIIIIIIIIVIFDLLITITSITCLHTVR